MTHSITGDSQWSPFSPPCLMITLPPSGTQNSNTRDTSCLLYDMGHPILMITLSLSNTLNSNTRDTHQSPFSPYLLLPTYCYMILHPVWCACRFTLVDTPCFMITLFLSNTLNPNTRDTHQSPFSPCLMNFLATRIYPSWKSLFQT